MMTNIQPSSLELLSALADGELAARTFAGGEAAAELAGDTAVFLSPALYGDWNSYQVIGHTLKAGAASAALIGADPAFLQRLNLRLADEKLSLAVVPASSVGLTALANLPAANDAVFRWKLVAGFSSLSAALVVAWSFAGTPEASTAPQLSQSRVAEQVVVLSPQGPIVRDARLDELMAAHKQLGGSSLQAPSGFLSNAGFENSPSGRR